MTGTADSILFSRKEHICYTQNYSQFVTFITSIINECECQLICVINYSWIIQPGNITDNQTVCVLVSHHIKILFYVVIVVTTVYHVVSTFFCLLKNQKNTSFLFGLWYVAVLQCFYVKFCCSCR